jgi:NAD(P) transhydrogenase subunit alpha
MIENDAGIKAFATDENYTAAGATTGSSEEIIKAADIILAINQPQIDTSLIRSKVLLGVYQPLFNHS